MRINDLRYNAAVGAFEASVDISRNGRIYCYPCALHAPQSLDPASVTAGLAARALHMSDAAFRMN
jgi:hypothetical protein